jgi:Tol biopolymer transport system component
MQGKHQQTFCTACAAPLSTGSLSCQHCGARQMSELSRGDSVPLAESERNPSLVRLLGVVPIFLLLAVAGGLLQRHSAEQEWLASTYAAAASSAAEGDLVGARDSFSVISGYSDVDHRISELDKQLEPLEASYLDGLQAIEEGNYAVAVELLQPVADQAPGLKDVVARLDDAKNLLADDLRRDADAAETVHNWPNAEQTLRQLVDLDSGDTSSRQRLAALQREHGPIVLGKDRALWLVAPDGSEAHQLSDALHVIWPVWSPDRSQIAFLAPDPDDPMGNVSLYNVGVDGASPQLLASGVSAHAPPIWSPDGNRLAYTSFAGYDPVYETGSIGVRIVDVTTGKETDVTGPDLALAFNPSWSPDGKEVAFIVKHQGLGERPQHSPGDVFVSQLGKEGFQNLTNGSVRDIWSVAWSPSGDQLLLFSLFGQTWYEPPTTSIRILDRATGAIRQLAEDDEQPTMPVWSPDGTRFAFTMDEKTIVLSSSQGERQTFENSEPLSGELTWSPDGRAVLFAPWDADTASTLLDLTTGTPSLSSIRFEFDSSPPFISPPQWASNTAIAPADNPSLSPASPSVVAQS